MPADPITALEARTMTDIINNRHKPRLPLTALLFGSGTRSKNLTTETVQVDTLVGTYEMAPMVNKDGKAVSISRKNFDSATIETPCIKLEMPLSDSDLLLQRRAGNIDVDTDGVDYMKQSALEQINEDIESMEIAIAYRTEWMISQLLQGGISYTNDETGASFALTLSKPAGNTFTVPVLWNVEAALPLIDIKNAKKVAQIDNHGPAPTIGLMGANAADALRTRIEKGWVNPITRDSGVAAGSASLLSEWEDMGLCFIARLGNVDFWEVAAQYTDDKGVVTDAIRTDYVEFIPNSQTGVRDRITYYGKKRSATAVEANRSIGKVFARSYIDTIRDVWMSEIQSRPLTWWEHPQWYVSMKVI